MTSHKLYHIGSALWGDLRTKAQLDPTIVKYSSDHCVSLFLHPITRNMVNLYIKEGFTRWDMAYTYLYEIDPKHIQIPVTASMESIPQQRYYDQKHWPNNTDEMDDDSFFKWKKDYIKKRDKYLKERYGIPPTGQISQYQNNECYKTWMNEAWLYDNLRTGNRDQYASNIPHMLLKIEEPLKYDKVTRIR